MGDDPSFFIDISTNFPIIEHCQQRAIIDERRLYHKKQYVANELRAVLKESLLVSMNGDIDKLASILENYQDQQGSLIPVLEEIQDQCLYLSRESLQLVSAVLGLPLSQVYNVATFYNAFSLKPRGRHMFSICMGTACHVKGAEKILRKGQEELQIGPGETTGDMMFTMETVRCVGCCSLAPVVRVDDQTFGHVTTKKVSNVLKQVKTKSPVKDG